MENISSYDVLQIHRDCTIDELKTKFKQLACKHHPDKGGDKHIFNLIVNSFKNIHRDIRAKESDKQFYTLKQDHKQNDIDNKPDYRVAKDGFQEKFNKFFNENKTVDQNFERGYDKFIGESDVKTSHKHYKIKKYKEPEGSVSSKLPFQELGATIRDYSGKNDDLHKLQYMDYQYAHTTSKLIDPDMVEKRQEFKDYNDIKKQRANAKFELTDKDMKYYERINEYKDKKEQKRIAKLIDYDQYLDNHNKQLGTRFLE